MQYINIQMPLYTVFLVLCAKILVKQLIYWYIYIHNSLQEWVYQGSRTKYGSIAVYVTAFSMALGRVTQAVHITKESMRTSLIISCFSMYTSMQSWRHYIFSPAPHAWCRTIYGVPKVWLLESLKKGVKFKNILVNFDFL